MYAYTSAMLGRLAARSLRPALVDSAGAYTYGALAQASLALSAELQQRLAGTPLPADGRQRRVAYLCPRDSTSVQSQLAAWPVAPFECPLKRTTLPLRLSMCSRTVAPLPSSQEMLPRQPLCRALQQPWASSM